MNYKSGSLNFGVHHSQQQISTRECSNILAKLDQTILTEYDPKGSAPATCPVCPAQTILLALCPWDTVIFFFAAKHRLPSCFSTSAQATDPTWMPGPTLHLDLNSNVSSLENTFLIAFHPFCTLYTLILNISKYFNTIYN